MTQMHTYFKCYEKQATENTERIFKMFDENDDGKFQKNEMEHFLQYVLETEDSDLKYSPPREGEDAHSNDTVSLFTDFG